MSSAIIDDFSQCAAAAFLGVPASIAGVEEPGGTPSPVEATGAALDFLSALLACFPQSQPAQQVVSDTPASYPTQDDRGTAHITSDHARPEWNVPDRSAPGSPLGRAPEPGADGAEDSTAAAVAAPVLSGALPTAGASPAPAQSAPTAGAWSSAPVALDVVTALAPPAGPSSGSAAPARLSADGPLPPPPTRAESAILSARDLFPPADAAVPPPHAAPEAAPATPADGASVAVATGAGPAPLASDDESAEPSSSPGASSNDDSPPAAVAGAGRQRPLPPLAAGGIVDQLMEAMGAAVVGRPRAGTISGGPTDPRLLDAAPAVSAELRGMIAGPAPEKPAPARAETRGAPVQRDSGAESSRNEPGTKPPEAAIRAEPYRPEIPPLRQRAARDLRLVRPLRAESAADLPADRLSPSVIAGAPSIADAKPPATAHVADVARSVDLALLDQLGPGALKASQLSRVTIQLHPPELGTVAVAVESRNGRVYAHFHSTHPFVNAWIETHAPALRSHMTAAGVPLQDISVSTSAQEQGSHERRHPLARAENAQRERAVPPPVHQAAAGRSIDGSAVDWLA